ncbi:MAG: hypothetical protein QF809_01710, partial [Candidatus Peribacteraceae bacterium]|nr:hypothetical protein [Candidatus Peribacteraceae bacterium]
KGTNGRIYDPEPKVVAQLDLSGPRSQVSSLYLPDGETLLHDIRASIARRGREFIDNKKQVLLTEHLGRTK